MEPWSWIQKITTKCTFWQKVKQLIITYFRDFKFWFFLMAISNATAPPSSTLLLSRLLNQISGQVCINKLRYLILVWIVKKQPQSTVEKCSTSFISRSKCHMSGGLSMVIWSCGSINTRDRYQTCCVFQDCHELSQSCQTSHILRETHAICIALMLTYRSQNLTHTYKVILDSRPHP